MENDGKGYEYDMFTHVESSKQRHPTNLFIALLKNEEFKNKFIEYYKGFVKNIVQMSIINPILKEFDEEIIFLIGYSISRWKGYLRDTKEEYLLEVIQIYKKNFTRNKKILKGTS